jgi:NADH:ubiquinone oxidoreductase subunit C
LDDGKLEVIVTKTGAQVTKDRRSTVLTVSSDKVREMFKILQEELPDFYHLSTITGFDEGGTIGVLYHFWKGQEFLSIKTSVPKENAALDTISDLLPAAILYEAEVKDLLGVEFKGNRVARQRLILPDSYPPDAPPPLRKEADPEKIRKMMQLE